MSKKSKITRPNRDPDHYSKRGVPYWWAPEWIRGTSADTNPPVQMQMLTLPQVLAGVKPPPPQQIVPANAITTSDGSLIVPCASYGKIHAVKENGDVNLYMKSKDGKLSYIQGSIQDEFKRWHEDRSIDYMLFGLDPDEIILDEN